MGLEPRIRELLERYFGENLSRVRVHGGIASRLICAVHGNAEAVVYGRFLFLSGRGMALYRSGRVAGVALIAHEVRHALQYAEHGFFGFLARYLGAYLQQRLAGASHLDAYRGIPLEEEARLVEREVRGLCA